MEIEKARNGVIEMKQFYCELCGNLKKTNSNNEVQYCHCKKPFKVVMKPITNKGNDDEVLNEYITG